MAKASLFDDMDLTDEQKYVRSINGYSTAQLLQMVNNYCSGCRLVWSNTPQPVPGAMPNQQGQVNGFQFSFTPEQRIALLNEAGTAADLFIFSAKWKLLLEDVMNSLPTKSKRKYLDPLCRPGDPFSVQRGTNGSYVLPGTPDGYELGTPNPVDGTIPITKLPEEE